MTTIKKSERDLKWTRAKDLDRVTEDVGIQFGKRLDFAWSQSKMER